MNRQLLLVLKALVSAKKELTLREVADLTSLTKGQIKAAFKGNSLIATTKVPFGNSQHPVLCLSITDAGIEFVRRLDAQRSRITKNHKPLIK